MRWFRRYQEGEYNNEMLGALFADFYQFFSAGGVLTPDDWDQMDSTEHEMASRAKRLVNLEQAAQLSMAIVDPAGFEQLLTDAGAGQDAAENKVQNAVARAMTNMNNGAFADLGKTLK